ncbi:MAG: AI-2E family transporter [Alphaproteobacteria bacterium]|nr:AI-2E family transporter [Alphaproteobacteria bacterium]MBV9371616.1 AI-2E family transporter [Alphaproteobacteria bacterium]MBV9901041.1 AI-2E family transporter [Alphaproteobacteria bacterium]
MSEPADPDAPPASAPAGRLPMRLLVLLLTLLGLWIARSFLLELAWAAVMAVALWPLYSRHARAGPGGRPPILAPLGFTLALGLLLMLPLALVAVEAARDSQAALGWVAEAQKSGVRAPGWLGAFPYVGPRLVMWWQAHLSNPRAAAELLGETDAGALARWTGAIAAQVASRSAFFLLTLLALFIILRDGSRLAATSIRTARHFYGDFGERFLLRLAEAVRGAVNGTVFVAIGEGTIIGFGYALAGVPRPVLFALATIAFAMLPFGAWAAFSLASLILLVQGHVAAAIALFAFGAAVMLIGDNLVQPALVGGAVELPFLWTFIATFGGLETFGLVGLFIGPAVMAALFLVWREWLGEEAPPKRPRGRLRRRAG